MHTNAEMPSYFVSNIYYQTRISTNDNTLKIHACVWYDSLGFSDLHITSSHHIVCAFVVSFAYVLPDFAFWFRPEMFPTHPLSPAKPPSRQEIASLTQCLQDVAKRLAASASLQEPKMCCEWGAPKIQTRPSIRIDITNNITPHNMAFMFTTQLVNVDQCWFALFGSSWYHMSSVHMLFHVMFTFPKFALVLDSEMFWFWFHE